MGTFEESWESQHLVMAGVGQEAGTQAVRPWMGKEVRIAPTVLGSDSQHLSHGSPVASLSDTALVRFALVCTSVPISRAHIWRISFQV
jgi:hypothetical protein